MANSFAELVGRLKAEDGEASREVFERFTHQLFNLAPRRFQPAFRRPILELSLQGYTTREISEQLARAERTVRLVRESASHRLERLQRGTS
jgi:DNA-binding NarL/FixJ family response regulator